MVIGKLTFSSCKKCCNSRLVLIKPSNLTDEIYHDKDWCILILFISKIIFILPTKVIWTRDDQW